MMYQEQTNMLLDLIKSDFRGHLIILYPNGSLMSTRCMMNPEENDGNKTFICPECGQHLASKQRLRTHHQRKHENNCNELKDGCKEDLYTKNESSSYQCDICRKELSSKQRILEHLYRQHGKSPLKKTYKLYEDDSNIPVPKTTLYRKSLDFLPAGQNGRNESHEGNQYFCSDLHENFETDSDCSLDFSEQDIDSENSDLNSVDVSLNDTNSSDDGTCLTSSSSVDSLSDSIESINLSDSNESFSSTLQNDLSNEHSNIDQNNTNPGLMNGMCILAYALRYNLSRDAITSLIELIKVICPKIIIDEGVFQQTKETEEVMESNIIHYCEKCGAIFPNDPNIFICQSLNCGEKRYKGNAAAQIKDNRQPRCSFIIADIEFQLKHILERSNNWEQIKDFKNSVKSSATENISIHDIRDGQLYRNLCNNGKFLNDQCSISALMNTDGVNLYNSSKVKLWPIFLAINELPPAQRFSRNNLVLAAIWQGKGSPPFAQYIYSFASSLKSLSTNGFTISPSGNENLNIKLDVICLSVDLQAKAYLANMSMHNGEYGCSTCEEPGKVVKKGKGHVRSYQYHSPENRPPNRTSTEILESCQHATPNKRKKGVCGVSGLSAFTNLDIVEGLVPDYMHGVLLGVTKYMMNLWFSATNSSKPYFVGNFLDDISRRVQKMTPPDCIERLPRNLENHYSNFKATELQTWLLYYSVPCLTGIMPDLYLEHFCKLSEGIFLLLGDNISPADLVKARSLLDGFYCEFVNLYGVEYCTLNLHNIGFHLTDFVLQWGPIWAWSCFPFEDCNAAILQAVHGTGDITKQYIHTKEKEMELNSLDLEKFDCHAPQKSFLHKMRQSNRNWKNKKCMRNCEIAGKLISLSADNIEDETLQSVQAQQVSEVCKILRVELNGQKYYSEEYSRMKKRVCNFVISRAGDILAIKHFLVNKQTKYVYAVADIFELHENCFFFESCGHHIFKLQTQESSSIVLPVNMIKEKVFYIGIEELSLHCVALLPNVIGRSIMK